MGRNMKQIGYFPLFSSFDLRGSEDPLNPVFQYFPLLVVCLHIILKEMGLFEIIIQLPSVKLLKYPRLPMMLKTNVNNGQKPRY